MDILIIILLLALIGFSFYQFRQKGDSSSGNSNTLQNIDLKVARNETKKIVHLQEKLKEVNNPEERTKTDERV